MGSAQDHGAPHYGGMLLSNVKEKPAHADDLISAADKVLPATPAAGASDPGMLAILTPNYLDCDFYQCDSQDVYLTSSFSTGIKQW
jgi:hypothetical protein